MKDKADRNLDRRDFLRMASAGVASTVVAASSVKAAVETLPNETGPYDVVIKGGRVIDPETGLDAVRHVGIKDGRIGQRKVDRRIGRLALVDEFKGLNLECLGGIHRLGHGRAVV